MITIDAGIGKIEYQEPENLKLKNLMEDFSDLLEVESIDDVKDFLGKFKERNDFTKAEDLQWDLNKSEERVDELLTEIEELKEAPTEFVLQCGIGTIEYNADNIQLQLIMEALGEQITEHGALKVLQDLQPVNA